MVTIEESIAEIKLLLPQFNGVTVLDTRYLEKKVIFELKIVDAASILWMEEMAAAANIREGMFALGPPHDGDAVADSLGKLRFTYSIPTDDDKLEWYGCHLVWNLAARKILDLPEADRLMKLWDGRPRW